jgi:hypothetical protein
MVTFFLTHSRHLPDSGMARQLRFVYPGAVYHVMARGDGGKKLFLTDSDHLLFLGPAGSVLNGTALSIF